MGLAEPNGMAGRHSVWNLFSARQKILPVANKRATSPPEGCTGAKVAMAGFGPHGVAVTDRAAASSTLNRPALEVDLSETTPT